MNIFIILLLFILFLIPLWLLFSRGEGSTGTSTVENDMSDLTFDEDGKPVIADLPEKKIQSEPESDFDEDLTPIDDDFKLPHPNNTIITPDSPFNIYRRTLENTQYYLEKGDFDTARDLYNGLIQRISDKEIRRKIDENVEYINNYQQISANRIREKKIKNAAGDNEIRVSMGGQEFVPENIKIDITPPSIQPKIDMDEVLQSITGHIARISPAIRESNANLSELLEYREEIEKVKNDIRSLYDLKEESHRAREQRIDEDLARIDELREQIERENEERIKNQQIDDLKYEIDKLKSERAQYSQNETDLNAMREQMASLKQELVKSSQAQNEIGSLKNTIESLRNELKGQERINSDVSVLTEQILSLSNQLQSLNTGLDETQEIKQSIEDLQSKIKSGSHKEEDIVSIKNQVEVLTRQIDSSDIQNEAIRGVKDEIKSLGDRFSEREEARRQMNSLQSQIEELKGELTVKEEKASEIDLLKNQIQNLQGELDTQRQAATEVGQLKRKMEELESERLEAMRQQSEAERKILNDQIETLKQELVQSRKASDKASEISELKDAISNLEKKSSDKKIQTEQLKQLQSEIGRLSKDAALSADMEQKIDSIVKNGLAGMSSGGAPDFGALADAINGLKSELTSNSQQATPAGLPHSENDSSEIQSTKEKADTASLSPETGVSEKKQGTAGKEPGFDSNINLTPKREEDNEEDFETLQDHLAGPQFEEPSEDEILEKILSDTAKGKEKEYEIHGRDDTNDLTDSFDISKLFAAPKPDDIKDEEFYSQFMERNKKRVKKELPILNVSYRFDKLPELSSLSKESNIIESTFYKYKGLLEKANEHIKRRQVNDAINYYQTVLAQDIPEEFKKMIRQNINDLNEYLEKYMLNM
jgi:hypothetical protein